MSLEALRSSTILVVAITEPDGTEYEKTLDFEDALSLLDDNEYEDDYVMVVLNGSEHFMGDDLKKVGNIDEYIKAYNEKLLDPFCAYCQNQHYHTGLTYSGFTDDYVGEFDSDADCMESELEDDIRQLEATGSDLCNYIDFQKYWDNCGSYVYYAIDTYYFRV